MNSEIVVAPFLATVKVERSALFRACLLLSGGEGAAAAKYATRVSVDRYLCQVFLCVNRI